MTEPSQVTDPIDVPRLLSECPVAEVEYYDSIGSTHDVAHERARENRGRRPLLVVAETQTAGRGRGPNQWFTGRGSLAFSLVFDPADWQLAGELPAHRSLAVGVAMVDAVAPLVPEVRVGLHWPNDVFAGPRKLAGILVDVLAGGRHVIGIGLNVNNSFAAAPSEVAARAISLSQLAHKTLDRTSVLCEVLKQLKSTLQAAAADPAGFGSRFQPLCLQVGQQLTLNAAGRQVSGRCAGIAPDGALLLETDRGLERHYSGTLVH